MAAKTWDEIYGEKAMAKELARRLMIRFREVKQAGEFAALSSLILRRQGLKIAAADDLEIAQAIERNAAADAELMGKQYDVVELDVECGGIAPGFDRDGQGGSSNSQSRTHPCHQSGGKRSRDSDSPHDQRRVRPTETK